MTAISNPDLPEVGDGVCCAGAAMFGAGRCTCWEPVYDRAQAELVPAPPQDRDRMCSDCAYRPESPERRGEPDVAGDAESLEHLAAAGIPFWCHDGIRRPLVLRHPSGAEITGHAAAYDPPIRDGVPYRADGTPAYLCAGWAARHRAIAARPPEQQEAPEVQEVQEPQEIQGPQEAPDGSLAVRALGPPGESGAD